jgi:protein involved in polysaccharide export with SLBB domain
VHPSERPLLGARARAQRLCSVDTHARLLAGVRLRLMIVVAALSACQTAGGPPLSKISTEINSTLEPEVVVLGVGDKIAVRFPYSPTWNQEVDITTDGSASFMAIGRLIVAGMSLGRLKEALNEAYSHVFQDHELDVVVKTRGARKVYVMGELKRPGEFELDSDRRLTLLDALARAGGPLKESAYLAHTLLIRWNASKGTQMTWVIDAREEHWRGPEPVYLQPYDFVFVPNTPVDAVAVWVDNYIRRMLPFPYIVPPVR